MYFWGLTIDTVSTVVIIIAVGLSVDYASHVGHTFLVKSGNRKGKIENSVRSFCVQYLAFRANDELGNLAAMLEGK